MITSLLAEHRPLLMGILNLTPDSFSGDGKIDVQSQLASALQLIADGADILDVGGESTRPQASPVSSDDEIQRILPFLTLFRRTHRNFPISLDTTKAEVARVAASAGLIQIINDVSFLRNPELAEIAQDKQLWYVLMHARGTPLNMDTLCDYSEGISSGVAGEIQQKLAELKHLMPMNRVILDPGIGFAKTSLQSKTLYDELASLQVFSLPVLLGLSRKRFLTDLGAPISPVQDRDELSAKLSVNAALAGSAQILRVHNVALTKKILTDSKRQS